MKQEVDFDMALVELFVILRTKCELKYIIEILVLSQAGCYHGDTLGTMNLASPNFYNMSQHPWYTPKCIEVAVPRVHFKKGRLCVDVTSMEPSMKVISLR